jgi:hypothetical protein
MIRGINAMFSPSSNMQDCMHIEILMAGVNFLQPVISVIITVCYVRFVFMFV